ncbi:hypothetical protein ACVNS2_04665 [Paenibacillus caseinilyticus]|uniref:Uncharacterized protein n=1 Tax=Paenibacillus mucilaginosus K02 TaxID=997761 RepID=R9UP31_9BACL|nr:hypothetical protein [Paenibacillus mucilaginosus]AGN70572.1 hypothetical protein B2K_38520 [Paenibacillus mucilaginosus K02]
MNRREMLPGGGPGARFGGTAAGAREPPVPVAMGPAARPGVREALATDA